MDESNIGFVRPPEIEPETHAYDVWVRSSERAKADYQELLAAMIEQVGDSGTATMRKKRARQAARAVLPNSAETKILVTGNARAWRHFCEMRGSTTADVEIRRLAVATLSFFRQEAPHIFGDMRIVPHDDDTQVVETQHSKV